MNSKITILSLCISVLAIGQNHRIAAPMVVVPITASIAFQGYDESEAYYGQGEYEIFPDTNNGIIDKPIIVADGFDPTDGRDITATYALLNYGTGQNLADDLRAQGYDVVILNFPNYTRTGTSTYVQGGGDFIQRNAMILAELINQINGIKVGAEKNVVIGPSMGGLIARYALRYMEMNSMNHDTRLYISFDSPHNGANIPIGYQHLFNYMAYGDLGDATVQVVVDAMLKSAASREMLIDSFEGHLQDGSITEFNPDILLPTGKPNFRNVFQAELDAMGYPQNCRNVAIANGAGNGSMTGTPGMTVMDHTFNITSSQRAIINLHFAPAANQTTEVSRFRGQGQIFGFWITAYESAANSKSTPTSDGLDSAPGGKFDITSLSDLAGTNALLTEFFASLLIDSFDFIPTLSAVGIAADNWYTPFTAASVTPFDATYVPDANENHVTLSEGNVAFTLNEILSPTMSVQQQTAISGLQVQNPVGNEVVLSSNREIENAVVSITDISGKSVYSSKGLSFQGQYKIAVALQSGVYILKVESAEGTIIKKLLKN